MLTAPMEIDGFLEQMGRTWTTRAEPRFAGVVPLNMHEFQHLIAEDRHNSANYLSHLTDYLLARLATSK